MSDLITMLSAASGAGGGAETDPNFNQTTLLLHGDGTNGAQNNTFLDSSTNNFTITRNGNTTQGTFSPFSVADGAWSNYFDGSGDYLSIAANSAFLYTGDFTVEMWVYPLVFSDFRFLFGTGGSGTQDQANIYANGTYVYFDGTNSVTSPTLNLNAWNHIAVTRSGTTIRAYANGVSGASATISGNLGSSATAFRIAERSDGLYDNNCYMSNLRVVNGTAVYTGSTYTVPTAPLTAIANTSLLTCQSNRFVDNSTNNFAITVAGNTSIQPFSPFAPSAAYSPSVNGGSGYFDGTGDYLDSTTSQVIPTGNFTIEAFVYVTNTDATQTIVAQGTGSGDAGRVFMGIESSSGAKWTVQVGGTQAISSVVPVLNTWHYVAMVYNGSTIKMYLNGTEIASANSSTNASNTTVRIGSNWGGYDFFGYISNVKISDTAKTISSIPTTPFTDDANTELLLNFTNAGILDNTGKNNLETVGNAQIDTTTKKYGTGSMEFDGTGDYLLSSSSIELSGNYTIEFWVNQDATSGYTHLTLGDSATASGLQIYYSSAGQAVRVLNNTSLVIDSSTSLTAGVFYHIALVRNGSSNVLYIDGTAVGSAWTSSTTFSGVLRVGVEFYSGSLSTYLDGFIDDLRITKGVARYTANFSVPTKAFPDL